MAARRSILPTVTSRVASAELLDRMTTILAERGACERLIEASAEQRPSIVAAGTLDELERHDREVERNRLRIEQCDARHAEIAEQHAEAVEREEQHRRLRLYEDGTAARKRAVAHLAAYQARAAELATTLRAYRSELDTIAEANAALPPGSEPIPPAEPFNGRSAQPASFRPLAEIVTFFAGTNIRAPLGGRSPHPTETRQIETQVPVPAVPGIAHRSLLDDVVLPGIGPEASSFWRGITSIAAETAKADAEQIHNVRFIR